MLNRVRRRSAFFDVSRCVTSNLPDSPCVGVPAQTILALSQEHTKVILVIAAVASRWSTRWRSAGADQFLRSHESAIFAFSTENSKMVSIFVHFS
jgi:hypothetical protein